MSRLSRARSALTRMQLAGVSYGDDARFAAFKLPIPGC